MLPRPLRGRGNQARDTYSMLQSVLDSEVMARSGNSGPSSYFITALSIARIKYAAHRPP